MYMSICFVVNLLLFVKSIKCWSYVGNMEAFEDLSFRKLSESCFGEDVVKLSNLALATAIVECFHNSSIASDVIDLEDNSIDKVALDIDSRNQIDDGDEDDEYDDDDEDDQGDYGDDDDQGDYGDDDDQGDYGDGDDQGDDDDDQGNFGDEDDQDNDDDDDEGDEDGGRRGTSRSRSRGRNYGRSRGGSRGRTRERSRSRGRKRGGDEDRISIGDLIRERSKNDGRDRDHQRDRDRQRDKDVDQHRGNRISGRRGGKKRTKSSKRKYNRRRTSSNNQQRSRPSKNDRRQKNRREQKEDRNALRRNRFDNIQYYDGNDLDDRFEDEDSFRYYEDNFFIREKRSYRPDDVSIADLFRRELILKDKFTKYECVLRRRLQILRSDSYLKALGLTDPLSEELKEDLRQSSQRCADYVDCLMEAYNDTNVFPRELRHVHELTRCTQRQARISCIKNDIRKLLPERSILNGTLYDIFEDLLQKIMEITSFNGDFESFDVLLE